MSTAPTHPLAADLPLFGLLLRTPRLALRPVWDEDIVGLADAAVAGIHPADQMPFVFPWSRAPRAELLAGTAKSIWRERAGRTPDDWGVSFAVRRVDASVERWWEAPVIGRQDVEASNFPLLRSVSTGSWLTASAQRQGLGQEMRHAVLLWAFTALGASEATSAAYAWNSNSLKASHAVGYEDNGVRRALGDGKMQGERHFRITPALHRRPEWKLQISGDEPGILAELGVPDSTDDPGTDAPNTADASA